MGLIFDLILIFILIEGSGDIIFLYKIVVFILYCLMGRCVMYVLSSG